MRAYLLAIALAAVVCALLTPLVRKAALRLGALSHPGGRHVHHAVVPRMGGAGIYLAIIGALAVLFRLNGAARDAFGQQAPQAFGLLFGATAMTALGLADDVRGLRAIHKLLGQLAIATGAFFCGFRLQDVWVPGFGSLSMGVFGLPVTLLWIVGIVNAINLIDGLDGLAAGVVLFAAATNFVVAFLSGSTLIAFVMATMIGALLGFLLFNFNPARIFMGDSGSYLLGYVLATSALVGSQKTSTAVSLLVPCLALGVPIFDTLFSIVRRFLERRPIFSPDRGHLHHRLLDMGLTHRRAVLTLYGVSAVFSTMAIALWAGKEWQGGIVLLVSSAVLFALMRFAGYVEYVQRTLRRRAPVRGPAVQALRGLLPELPLRLRDATSEADLFGEVRRVAQRMGAQRVELRAQTMGPPAFLWEGTQPSSSGEDITTLSLPLGDNGQSRAQILFTMSQVDVAAPECEILLLLLSDMVGLALVTVNSPLAPQSPLIVQGPAPAEPFETDPIRVTEPTSHG